MIYFREADKAKNIEQLIRLGFESYSGPSFVETYSDSNFTLLECKKAFRSFNALLEICQTYFPNTTAKELAKLLFDTNKFVYALFCNTIDEVVFTKFDRYDDSPGTDNMFYRLKENAYYHVKGKSGISFEDIYNLSIED
jgi:hypothetical protein